MYTELHRALGVQAGAITDEMIDELIAQKTVESRGLDFKQSPPPEKELKNSDMLKDVAAMANTGGGVIVFGITDDGGKAGNRIDLSEKFGESFQRTFKRLAITSIDPPVFGLELFEVGEQGALVGVVVIPDSSRAPHMIAGKDKFKDYFAVPVRNGPDTQFLSEVEISRMYRERFELDRNAREQIQTLYNRSLELTDDEEVWLVGAARPKHQTFTVSPSSEEIFTLASAANGLRGRFGYGGVITPLSGIHSRAKRGFRSWRFSGLGKERKDAQTYLSFHDDGSVQVLGTLTNSRPGVQENIADASQLECYIADTMLAARAQAERTGVGDYDILIGLTVGTGREINLDYEGVDVWRFPEEAVSIKSFIPVSQSVDLLIDDDELRKVICMVIVDCINQAGLSRPRVIRQESNTGE